MLQLFVLHPIDFLIIYLLLIVLYKNIVCLLFYLKISKLILIQFSSKKTFSQHYVLGSTVENKKKKGDHNELFSFEQGFVFNLAYHK